MSNWTSGYMADIDYTYGYYAELNPTRIALAFLEAGLAAPKVGTACELGFGQGITSNVHAAGSVVSWHGTDFNPSQAGFARELAEISGNGAQLFDEAFGEFCTRADLPDFDFIALHGIWSWISDENRKVIIDFLRRKLKVGGVLYISYNTLPGWSGFAPLRHLMTEHAAAYGTGAHGILNRIKGALDFGDQVMAVEPRYGKAVTGVQERLNQLKTQDQSYLAHEYFNSHWLPMYFADIAKWLDDAKLDFACSANYFDAVPVINLTEEQQKFLGEIPDNMFRETVRDFLTNQQFRKDYWVKGARRISALERTEQQRAQKVILTQPRSEISMKVKGGALGEASLNEQVYSAYLDAMADNKVHSLGDLETQLDGKDIAFSAVLQATLILTVTGAIGLVQEPDVISKARKPVQKLNAQLMHLSRSRGDITYLASPVTGGAVNVHRIQQIFLLARQAGHKLPDAWADFVWQLLSSQGQGLIKEGNPVTTAEENLKELREQAEIFAVQYLPILKSLQIA